METQIKKRAEIDDVAAALKQEKVVAFPTETVYGLGVIYDSVAAVERLIEAKQRDMSKRFTLMLSDKEELDEYVYVSYRDQLIIDKFMPGDITVILNSKKEEGTIGIRIPDDAFVRELIRKTGKPLYVTSANISHRPSTTTTKEVLEQLNGRIPFVVEGECGKLQASSVVDLTTDEIKILRQGRITIEMIEEELK
ncbi:MAG: L-threonylcarbamoyladenylate synthase [Beduini sp.]|uniref:L-threonylcarbamoyladenylate synthase n=1 Tax=Beduini sp. TaxID=1922300 RepID=UPI0011CB9E1C